MEAEFRDTEEVKQRRAEEEERKERRGRRGREERRGGGGRRWRKGKQKEDKKEKEKKRKKRQRRERGSCAVCEAHWSVSCCSFLGLGATRGKRGAVQLSVGEANPGGWQLRQISLWLCLSAHPRENKDQAGGPEAPALGWLGLDHWLLQVTRPALTSPTGPHLIKGPQHPISALLGTSS